MVMSLCCIKTTNTESYCIKWFIYQYVHTDAAPRFTAMIIVAAVKYARVSTSSPTAYMWCDHTMKPRIPIENIA